MAGNSNTRVMVRSNTSVVTKQASADLSELAGRVMKDSSGKIAKATDDSADAAVGILVEAASSSTTAACAVAIDGPVFMEAGGTITEEADIGWDADGKGVVTTTKGDFFIGQAVEDAASGDFFEVNINKGRVGTYA